MNEWVIAGAIKGVVCIILVIFIYYKYCKNRDKKEDK